MVRSSVPASHPCGRLCLQLAAHRAHADYENQECPVFDTDEKVGISWGKPVRTLAPVPPMHPFQPCAAVIPACGSVTRAFAHARTPRPAAPPVARAERLDWQGWVDIVPLNTFFRAAGMAHAETPWERSFGALDMPYDGAPLNHSSGRPMTPESMRWSGIVLLLDISYDNVEQYKMAGNPFKTPEGVGPALPSPCFSVLLDALAVPPPRHFRTFVQKLLF